MKWSFFKHNKHAKCIYIAVLVSNFKIKFSVSKLLQEIDRAEHNGSILFKSTNQIKEQEKCIVISANQLLLLYYRYTELKWNGTSFEPERRLRRANKQTQKQTQKFEIPVQYLRVKL